LSKIQKHLAVEYTIKT